MAQQFNRLPQFNQPLSQAGVTNKDWYFFFVGLFQGLAPAFESSVTLTGSPFTYSAPVKGSVIVNGGTVSQIRFSRDGSTFYNVGATNGMFPLNAADRLEVTYSVAPVVTFVPT
jgi:hypothetical protein